jgi:hypothetical protein
MDIKIKKRIAIEGLIFIACLLVFWAVNWELDNIYEWADLFFYMKIWLLVYLLGRFAIWAVMTLRQKDNQEKPQK